MTQVQQLIDTPAVRRWHVLDEIDLVPLVSDHVRTERLCQHLEAFADRLPDLSDAAERTDLCEDLQAYASGHASREALWLDDLFWGKGGALQHSVLAHLRARHIACAVQAQDLLAALRPEAMDRGLCAATLGYMIRCFFDGCRSRLVLEELAVFTLAGDRVTPAARLLLESRLQVSCGAS
jgi:hypothetical protein